MTETAFAFMTGIAMSLILVVIVGNYMYSRGLDRGINVGFKEGVKKTKGARHAGLPEKMIFVGTIESIQEIQEQLAKSKLPEDLMEAIRDALAAEKILDVTAQFK